MTVDRRTMIAGAASLSLATDPGAVQAPVHSERYQRGLAQLETTSQQEIIETILQMIPCAGFPAAINAITVARQVFAE